MATIYVTDRGYAVYSPDGRYLGTWTTLQGAMSATPYFDYLIRKEDPHGTNDPSTHRAASLGAHA